MELYNPQDDSGIKRIGFKAQMSELEIVGMEAMIDKCRNNGLLALNARRLGLAYTSSSGYAMLNVCCDYDNHQLAKIKGDEISHFAVLNDGRPVIVCRDSFENDVFYLIEN